MKKSTALGAVLCSAALAVGMAMPAFADTNSIGTNGDPDSFVPNTAGDSATQSTTVRLAGIAEDQIIATIPVDITVAAPAAGGAIQAPQPSVYTIVNGSAKDLKLTGAQVEGLLKGLNFVDDETAKALASNGSNSQAWLQLAAGNASAVSIATPTSDDPSKAAAASLPATTDWQATANGGKLNLGLSGKAFPAKTGSTSVTSFQEASQQFVKITYTVSLVTTE